MTRTTRIAATLACGLCLLTGTQSFAGLLNSHPDAYGGWTGTSAYTNGTLSGTLDFAVFTAADFNANFAGGGYVPADALVYTYQIINTGTDSVSQLTVGNINPAHTIGTFNTVALGGDVDSSAEAFIPVNSARWSFINPNEIPGGQESWGLAFSSPNVPQLGGGLILDGGLSALILNIPVPSDIPVPEPSSLALLTIGGMFAVRRNRK